MEEIQKLKAQIAKLAENQGRLVSKIQQIDFELSAYKAIADSFRDKFTGLETALLGANVLTRDGLDFHQSFNHDKLVGSNPQKKQENYADIKPKAAEKAAEDSQPVSQGAVSAQCQAEA